LGFTTSVKLFNIQSTIHLTINDLEIHQPAALFKY